MSALITFFLGLIAGFFAHALSMKVSFKQKTIENKIKVYDTLIAEWVKMRNFIFSSHHGDTDRVMSPQAFPEFDQMYGLTQQYIGEAFLVCEDEQLTSDINELNEKIYRTPWWNITLAEANPAIEEIKREALSIIRRMRMDVQASTRLDWEDFKHIFTGFFNRKTLDGDAL